MTVRRLPILSAALCAFGLAFASPAAAAPDPSICTASVWSDIQSYTAEDASLETAMNALNSRGIDTRAIFLADLGDGIGDVPEFERTVLRETCPQLFVDGEPKPDLFMLIVSSGDRKAGTVFGSRLSPFHNEGTFSDVADDNFRNGDFAGGLADYFDAVNDRIERAENPPAAPAQEPVSAESETPINWRPILIGIAIIIGLLVVGIVLYFAVRWLQERKQLQRSREMLLGRLSALRERYTKLVVGDLDSPTGGNTLQFLAYWIDKLPDDEDAELRAARETYNACVAEGAERLENAERIIREAKTDEDIADADAVVDELDRFLRAGTDALMSAETACQELHHMDEAFGQRLPEIIQAAADENPKLKQLEGNGFNTDSLRAELTTIVDGLTACEQMHRASALIAASNKLDDITASLEQLQRTVSDLPLRGERIASEAQTQRGKVDDLTAELETAFQSFNQLRDQYNPGDLEDIQSAPESARYCLDEVRTLIEQALAAGSMETQAYDQADEFLNRSAGRLDEAQALILSVRDRSTELSMLPQRLKTSIQELDEQAAALERYVQQVADDIDGDTRTCARTMYVELGELSRRLAAPKPPLLELERLLDNLDLRIQQCHAEAQAQHRKMESLRQDVYAARQNAKQRLDQAGSYRSYASSRYAAADGYFSGVLHGMTLQQQLNHWKEAYEAADAAYDEGYSDYQDAHRPTYSSSSSSSSSYDFGGGSSGHSFSSFGGGSSGGSSGHSW